MKRHRGEYAAGVLLLVLTAAWCAGAAHALYYRGDSMVGFHPLLLFHRLYAGALGLAVVVGLVLRKWRFAALTCLGLAALAVFIARADGIERWAWARSIARYDQVNRQAIRHCAAIAELDDETVLEQVGAGDALPVLDGFGWYCEHPLASPGGAFRVFRYRGVVHVRIQKIRHGYRGIALVSSDAELNALRHGAQLDYETEAPVGSGWVIWRMR